MINPFVRKISISLISYFFLSVSKLKVSWYVVETEAWHKYNEILYVLKSENGIFIFDGA